uniref:UDP-N-acetylglucosamine 2-epimerase domain-containing protein n=1 Tax=viral metagenome TaxID=1070528 RepID=A0A6C0JVL8_9ZZZZ
MSIKYYKYNSFKNANITIVMTTHDRKEQTLYTLFTISKSSFPAKVILVDDSVNGFFTEKELTFPFEILYITIQDKTWINPCVNYNLGFDKITTPLVIIQNAEVFHCGDIIKHVTENLNDKTYIVYDVGGTRSLQENHEIYKFDLDYEKIYKFQTRWYQHTVERPSDYHFLSAISLNNLKRLGGFDSAYANGACYDDEEFVYRIKHHLRLKIHNICTEKERLFGIHQWHEEAPKSYDPKYVKINQDLFKKLETTPRKTVVTITGIRPDFIRMSAIFKKLDISFNHVLIHTGQHYDELLSDVFFRDLEIRKPDHILNTGSQSSNHFEQLAYLSVNIPKLLKDIKPDIVLFLGDSNSAGVSFPLKKEGYKIGHIEAGMRSGDKRMLEEINRTVCDHCSDILFVYHNDYKRNLEKENITSNVFVVGNTIVEPCREFIPEITKRNDMILVDIHRPENFLYRDRLTNIIVFAIICGQRYQIPVKLLYFKRLKDALTNFSIALGNIEMIDLMSYKKYLDTIYHCKFIISDSGTGQEEPAMLNVPVVVPRDFTERPQSYSNGCSIKLDASTLGNLQDVFSWLEKDFTPNIEWLGDGSTSETIVKHLENFLG